MILNTNKKPRNDLSGTRVGRLIVLSPAGYHLPECGRASWYYLCRCDCGTEKNIAAINLRRQDSVSCGCYRSEVLAPRATKHGASFTPTYISWAALKGRCTNPRHHAWKHYGGRGIKVCDRWLESFDNFLADMGERPAGHSIDRIDVNGNYEPGNCRWATRKEQMNNQQRSR